MKDQGYQWAAEGYKSMGCLSRLLLDDVPKSVEFFGIGPRRARQNRRRRGCPADQSAISPPAGYVHMPIRRRPSRRRATNIGERGC